LGCLDDDAKRAFYNNRARLLSSVARQAFELRAQLVERGFALTLDRGGMRRAWLRGRDNLQKRYLIPISGYNLGLIWLRYPINEQIDALIVCILVIDGPYQDAILGTDLAMVKR